MLRQFHLLYFSDKERTAALISLCSLLNLFLPESQPNKNIYNIFEKFLDTLNLENWIVLYIFFEINLIKELGYDTNLKYFSDSDDDLNKIKKIKIDRYTYEVPNFLIKQKVPNEISKSIIKRSLNFTRNVFLNKFFVPNNLIFPKSRVMLENYYN